MSWRLTESVTSAESGRLVPVIESNAPTLSDFGAFILLETEGYDDQLKSLVALLNRAAPHGRLPTPEDKTLPRGHLTRCAYCGAELVHPMLFYSACLGCLRSYTWAEGADVLTEIEDMILASAIRLAARQQVKLERALTKLVEAQDLIRDLRRQNRLGARHYTPTGQPT